jgi:hypothetical protein
MATISSRPGTAASSVSADGEVDLGAAVASKLLPLLSSPASTGGAAGSRPGSATSPQTAEFQALVLRALTAALAQPQYAKGIIVDGVSCPWLPAAAAAKCLLMALGLSLEGGLPTAAATEEAAPAGKGAAKLSARGKGAASMKFGPGVASPDDSKQCIWEGRQQVRAGWQGSLHQRSTPT